MRATKYFQQQSVNVALLLGLLQLPKRCGSQKCGIRRICTAKTKKKAKDSVDGGEIRGDLHDTEHWIKVREGKFCRHTLIFFLGLLLPCSCHVSPALGTSNHPERLLVPCSRGALWKMQ